MQRAQGDPAGALTHYQASLAVAERWQRWKRKCEWQRDLSGSHIKIGDVQVERGDLAGALTVYGASHGIFERLAEADPGNAGWSATSRSLTTGSATCSVRKATGRRR